MSCSTGPTTGAFTGPSTGALTVSHTTSCTFGCFRRLGVGSVGEEVVVGIVVEGVVVVVEGEVGFVGTQHCLHAAPTATQRKGLAFPFHGLQMERNACSNITVNSPAL